MLELLLILVAIVLAYLLFFWFAARSVGRLVAKVAARHYEHTDWILKTGIAPDDWVEPIARKVRRRVARARSGAAAERAKSAGREALLDRLHRHLRYLERGNAFPDEAMRRYITRQIRAIGRTWEDASWEQIVGEEEFETPPYEARPH